MRKRTKVIAGCCTVGAAAVFCIGSLALAAFSMGIRRQTLQEAWEWQAAHEDVSFWDDLEKTEYQVESYDGYMLHAVLCRKKAVSSSSGSEDSVREKAGAEAAAGITDHTDASEKYVIISHGYTDNRYGALKYMKIYLDQGYSCIIYDLRGHGENEETFCTYGVREGKDLCALIEDSFQRYGADIELGLHGESLGSATTLSALGQLKEPGRVRFAVADCGFADIQNVMLGGLRQMHVPGFMFYAASAAAKIRYGYALTSMRPIDALVKNQVPVCFIHGEEDTFILPENSRRMHEADPGYSELHLVPDAGHAESVLKHPDLYREIVDEFLKKLS